MSGEQPNPGVKPDQGSKREDSSPLLTKPGHRQPCTNPNRKEGQTNPLPQAQSWTASHAFADCERENEDHAENAPYASRPARYERYRTCCHKLLLVLWPHENVPFGNVAPASRPAVTWASWPAFAHSIEHLLPVTDLVPRLGDLVIIPRRSGCPRSLVRRGGGTWESTNPHGLGTGFHWETPPAEFVRWLQYRPTGAGSELLNLR